LVSDILAGDRNFAKPFFTVYEDSPWENVCPPPPPPGTIPPKFKPSTSRGDPGLCP